MCTAIELAWGRLRRAFLRRFRPDYVRRMKLLRQGNCPECPHDVIDSRDIKFVRNVCGYHFRSEDDPFRWRDRLPFARAGLGELVIFSIALLLIVSAAMVGWVLGLPGWIATAIVGISAVLWLFVLWFFRDPERRVPTDPDAFLSPADGRITDIGEVDEPGFAEGRALRIGMFLSIFNVHVNRSPRAGRVIQVAYYPGRFRAAFHPKADEDNEQVVIDLEDADTGLPIRVKQIAGAVARRIVCWLRPGDQLAAGERFGMIKFGSRTELFVPADSSVEVCVRVGQSVRGGTTVLMRLRQGSKDTSV